MKKSFFSLVLVFCTLCTYGQAVTVEADLQKIKEKWKNVISPEKMDKLIAEFAPSTHTRISLPVGANYHQLNIVVEDDDTMERLSAKVKTSKRSIGDPSLVINSRPLTTFYSSKYEPDFIYTNVSLIAPPAGYEGKEAIRIIFYYKDFATLTGVSDPGAAIIQDHKDKKYLSILFVYINN